MKRIAIVVLIAMMLAAFALDGGAQGQAPTGITPTPIAAGITPTPTDFLGEPVMAFPPVYMPLVDVRSIPHMPPADVDGVQAADINFHIYGFHAVYVMVFPPVPSAPYWSVCWFGEVINGWSVGGHCDSFKEG